MSRPSRLERLQGRGRQAGGALALAAGLGLSACGHSAPTQFFTLDAMAPAAPAAPVYAGPPLKLVAVHIPPALDREELVSESPQGVMQVHDFEHWEAPLGLSARQAVIQDLAARLPSGSVIGPSTPGEGAATLNVDVVSFQVAGEGALMQADWSVTLPAGARGVDAATWRAPLAELHAPSGGQGGAATAQAFSGLLAQLSDRIAAGLPAAVAELQAERRAAEAAAAAAARPRVTTRSTQTTVTLSRSPG